MIATRELHRPVLKVCGATHPDDARGLARLGVDLIGLNFYPKSPRFLELERAREVRRSFGDRALAVGVFVNAPPAVVADTARRVGLDLLQFHGEEAPDDLAPYEERAIRAFRSKPSSTVTADAGGELERYDGFWGLLFDTPAALLDDQQYGGSGRAWRWQELAPVVAASPRRRILVAGGISPANAAPVLAGLPGIFGLDVCSGVEASPGRQSLDKVAAVLDAVRASAPQTSPPTSDSSGEHR